MNLKAPLLLSAVLPLAALPGQAHADLGMDYSFETAKEPLTTERIWKVSPEELNPHRRVWVLEQETVLRGVAPQERKSGKYGLAPGALKATARLHLRPAGPWYSELSKFGCEKRPNAWFHTQDGAARAGQAAQELWEKILKERRLRLSVQLDRVSETSEDKAASRAREIMSRWLEECRELYVSSAESQARQTEWNAYLEQATAQGICSGAAGLASGTPSKDGAARKVDAGSWKDRMPQPSEKPSKKLLARAPAKRWNGMYSVRLMVDVGGKRLNGQFLIDSSAPVSTMDPEWLRYQGVLPTIVRVPGAAPRRVQWAGGRGVGLPAIVDSVSLSGATLPALDFVIMDTELFYPPDYPGTCCDGILGGDFFRQYAIEFLPGPPPVSVLLYEREGFDQGRDMPWVEATTSYRTGDGLVLMSEDCGLGDRKKPSGARWNTADASILEAGPSLRSTLPEKADFWCDSTRIASQVPRSLVDTRATAASSLEVGMKLLGRGAFTLDLPHGRIWFPQEALDRPILANRSGVRLVFGRNREHERELTVAALQSGTPADALVKSGLKKGAVITRIDNVPSGAYDIGEVEQRLSGAYGDSVILEWKTPKGAKAATIELER